MFNRCRFRYKDNPDNHIHLTTNVYGYFFMKKIKQIIAVLLVLLQCFFLVLPVSAEENEKTEVKESSLYSKACALTDGESGRLLYGKKEDVPMANASTTKILTCILAMENCRMDEVVTAGKEAAAQPKVHLGMRDGQQFYLKDLLYGLMLESYNDCAYAIAEHVSGSVEKFADAMNEKAKELGCTDTHFVTPNGLDKEDGRGEHHTTAYDLCKIMSYCAWNSPASEQFLALTQTRSYSFASLDGTSYAVSNKNAFLDMMSSAITGKTGYTAKAGYCYVAAVEEGGRRYAVALLACGWPNHKTYRWSDAKTLFGYGLEYYHLYQGSDNIFTVDPLEVAGGYQEGTLEEWGNKAKLPLYVETDKKQLTFLKADWAEAEVRKEFTKIPQLPVKKGKELGKISYCVGNEELYSFKICAAEDIRKWDFATFLTAVLKEFLL